MATEKIANTQNMNSPINQSKNIGFFSALLFFNFIAIAKHKALDVPVKSMKENDMASSAISLISRRSSMPHIPINPPRTRIKIQPENCIIFSNLTSSSNVVGRLSIVFFFCF